MTEVALFTSCLVDTFFPDVTAATVRLLERLGVYVTIPAGQTCCGQPPYNAGFWPEARPIARHFLDVFADAPAIVTPTGSCATMVRAEFAHLFADEPELLAQATAVAAKTYELSEYLVDVLGVVDVGAEWHGRATWHDACHLSRALGIKQQPRQLLANVKGLELVEMREANCAVAEPWCCGFGGAFAVKQPAISNAMLNEKIRRIQATEVPTLISSDAGCILH
ncbi:MAG: (Fe-S)-binding protein, partial [Anaerolineae bacterium]